MWHRQFPLSCVSPGVTGFESVRFLLPTKVPLAERLSWAHTVPSRSAVIAACWEETVVSRMRSGTRGERPIIWVPNERENRLPASGPATTQSSECRRVKVRRLRAGGWYRFDEPWLFGALWWVLPRMLHSMTVARLRSCSVTVLASIGRPSIRTASASLVQSAFRLLFVVLEVAELFGVLRFALEIPGICASTRSRVSCEGPSTSMVEVWLGVTTVMTTVLCMALILIRKMLRD
jgi:hypothetical protein